MATAPMRRRDRKRHAAASRALRARHAGVRPAGWTRPGPWASGALDASAVVEASNRDRLADLWFASCTRREPHGSAGAPAARNEK